MKPGVRPASSSSKAQEKGLLRARDKLVDKANQIRDRKTAESDHLAPAPRPGEQLPVREGGGPNSPPVKEAKVPDFVASAAKGSAVVATMGADKSPVPPAVAAAVVDADGNNNQQQQQRHHHRHHDHKKKEEDSNNPTTDQGGEQKKSSSKHRHSSSSSSKIKDSSGDEQRTTAVAAAAAAAAAVPAAAAGDSSEGETKHKKKSSSSSKHHHHHPRDHTSSGDEQHQQQATSSDTKNAADTMVIKNKLKAMREDGSSTTKDTTPRSDLPPLPSTGRSVNASEGGGAVAQELSSPNSPENPRGDEPPKPHQHRDRDKKEDGRSRRHHSSSADQGDAEKSADEIEKEKEKKHHHRSREERHKDRRSSRDETKDETNAGADKESSSAGDSHRHHHRSHRHRSRDDKSVEEQQPSPQPQLESVPQPPSQVIDAQQHAAVAVAPGPTASVANMDANIQSPTMVDKPDALESPDASLSIQERPAEPTAASAAAAPLQPQQVVGMEHHQQQQHQQQQQQQTTASSRSGSEGFDANQTLFPPGAPESQRARFLMAQLRGIQAELEHITMYDSSSGPEETSGSERGVSADQLYYGHHYPSAEGVQQYSHSWARQHRQGNSRSASDVTPEYHHQHRGYTHGVFQGEGAATDGSATTASPATTAEYDHHHRHPSNSATTTATSDALHSAARSINFDDLYDSFYSKSPPQVRFAPPAAAGASSSSSSAAAASAGGLSHSQQQKQNHCFDPESLKNVPAHKLRCVGVHRRKELLRASKVALHTAMRDIDRSFEWPDYRGQIALEPSAINRDEPSPVRNAEIKRTVGVDGGRANLVAEPTLNIAVRDRERRHRKLLEEVMKLPLDANPTQMASLLALHLAS